MSDTADQAADHVQADGDQAIHVPAETVHAETVPADPPPADPHALDLDGIERDLADVEQALARLDAGTYWSDEVTGDVLPDDLLADHPTARRLTQR